MNFEKPSALRKIAFTISLVGAATSLFVSGVLADAGHGDAKTERPATTTAPAPQLTPSRALESGFDLPGRLRMPKMDPANGKKLFIEKACVACHSVNGVGGHDAPELDAHTMDVVMSPFDFAARMWNHAYGMILVQQEALDEQIELSGQELADLIAFFHNDEQQHTLSDDDITPAIRAKMDHGHGDDAEMGKHDAEKK